MRWLHTVRAVMAHRSRPLPLVFFAVLSLAGPLASLHAAITPVGDVEPANPSTWTSSTNAYIGNTSNGTLTVNSGSDLSSQYGYLGYSSGVAGVVTVTGTGSTWTNRLDILVGGVGSGTLYVSNGGAVTNRAGYIGFSSGSGAATVTGTGSTWTNSDLLEIGSASGTLNITTGGAVTVTNATHVEVGTGSGGKVDFGTGGGTLTTGSLYASPSQLVGTGTIESNGLISDLDLVFDGSDVSHHGAIQTITLNQPGQNIAVSLDVSKSNNVGDLGAGYSGSGSLTIRSGITVNSTGGYLGYDAGSTGTATVDGANSKWINGSCLYVGFGGNGVLQIENGGYVSNGGASCIGYSGLTGMATVDGHGSTWTSGGSLTVAGNGTLKVTNGGVVNNAAGYIGYNLGSSSIATVDGAGSAWTSSGGLTVGYSGSGALTVTNGGSVSSGSSSSFSDSIAYNPQSIGVVTVDGTGSSWTSHGGLVIVGSQGSGTLNVTNGGAVSGASADVGNASCSMGSVTVDGAGLTWTNSGYLLIGSYQGAGTLKITGGGTVRSNTGYIGDRSGSNGVATVDGAGSTWSITNDLCVGSIGTGTLNVTGGASVTVGGTTYVADNATGSTGTINFNTGGGTLTTGGLAASSSQLTGSGTINTRGLVTDVNLVFDSAASLSQTLTFNDQPNQDVTVRLDMANSPTSNGGARAGCAGVGSLTIRNGVTVNSSSGYVGYNFGSTGIVTVDGAGSKWTSGSLDVGYSGNGTLSIAHGGVVNTPGVGFGYIGYNSSSTGAVSVDGAGSKWTVNTVVVGVQGSGTLHVINGGAVNGFSGDIGSSSGSTGVVAVDGSGSTWTNLSVYVGGNSNSSGGSATLSITGGGAVTGTVVAVYNNSLLAIDVGRGSSLNVGNGSGSFGNYGNVRILAGAGVTAGNTYTPISAGTWYDSGTDQAVGGTWNTTNHQFTVSTVQAGMSGSPVSIDLASQQRVLINDSTTGWSLGASFLAKPTSTPLSFTATTISGGTLTALGSLLGAGETVLGGWNLSGASGYTAGDPVYLSFNVGHAQLLDDLQVWQYGGSGWTAYSATDLTYDRTYASLTATALRRLCGHRQSGAGR